MKLPRFIGIVDLAVLISLAIAVPLWSAPPPMEATDAIKGSDAERFAVALAEARVLADPANASKSAELAGPGAARRVRDRLCLGVRDREPLGVGAPDRVARLHRARR